MTKEQFQILYQAGKAAFESGRYQDSITHLEAACELMNYGSRLGGEARIWLVTAYHAANKQQEAVALGQKLQNHPYPAISNQSQRLLYIITAPRLKRPEEWMTKIPDLKNIADRDTPSRYVNNRKSATKATRKKIIEPEIDPSEIQTEDKTFIWVAIGLSTIVALLYLFLGI